jgi:hypothetical protein
MAKADDALADWTWLRDTLALAVAALGSEALAKERLTEWLAAGELPWTCMQWNGLDAEGIAKLKQKSSAGAAYFVPTSRRARGSKNDSSLPTGRILLGRPSILERPRPRGRLGRQRGMRDVCDWRRTSRGDQSAP